jgi:hypothetical protein
MSTQPNEKKKRRSRTVFRFAASGTALGFILIFMLHPNTGQGDLWQWLNEIDVLRYSLGSKFDEVIMATIVVVCTVSGGFFGRWWDDTA